MPNPTVSDSQVESVWSDRLWCDPSAVQGPQKNQAAPRAIGWKYSSCFRHDSEVENN